MLYRLISLMVVEFKGGAYISLRRHIHSLPATNVLVAIMSVYRFICTEICTHILRFFLCAVILDVVTVVAYFIVVLLSPEIVADCVFYCWFQFLWLHGERT